MKDIMSMSAEELEKVIEHHNFLYWERDAPEISDQEYDKLVERLKVLKPDSVLITTIPAVSTYGQEVVHEIPMLSMDKAYSLETTQKWAKGTGSELFVASAKLDGCSCSIVYENGVLIQASTRGKDGIGEDATDNVKMIANVPKKINYTDKLEVRGEVIMPLSVFNESYKDDNSNPRNLSSGSLKHKDPNETAKRRLIFIAHNVLYSDLDKESDKFNFLEHLGFNTVPHCFGVIIKGTQKVYDVFLKERESYDFEIDGVIFTVESVELQEKLGFTSHHPKYSIAWKIAGEMGTTILKDIKWQISRIGMVTPVAIVEPVELSGAIVKRATIHHAGFVRDMALSKGAVVEMSRRGMVIPKIERVIEQGSEPFEIPTEIDGEPLVLDGDFLRLVNVGESVEVAIQRIMHLVSVLDIDDLGDKTVRQLFCSETIYSPEDIFDLTKESIMAGMERSGERSAQNILDNINAKREIPLDVFLRSLGVLELGHKVSSVLTAKYKSLDTILKLTESDLIAIDGIGPSISESVVSGLRESRAFIDSYLSKNVKIVIPEEKEKIMGKLNGKSFLFTGTLDGMGRKEAQVLVSVNGGICASSVNKDLDFLVCGENESLSSKCKKAVKLIGEGYGLKILTQQEFMDMIGA